jgi:hypothetical protein
MVALAAVAGAVILLMKRNKGNNNGEVAPPTRRNLTPTPNSKDTPDPQGVGPQPLWRAQPWHPGNQQTPPHGQPLLYGKPPGVHLQQNPLSSPSASAHQASFRSATSCRTPNSLMALSSSDKGPSVRPGNFDTWDSLSKYGCASADTVSVTYIGGKHGHAVTTWTGSLNSFDFSTLNESSSPAEILNAQLDFITEARGGMLSRFVKCATSQALLLHACIMSASVWLPAGILRLSGPLSDLPQAACRCQQQRSSFCLISMSRLRRSWQARPLQSYLAAQCVYGPGDELKF